MRKFIFPISNIIERQFVMSYFITIMALFNMNVTVQEFVTVHCMVTLGMTIFLLITRELTKILLKITNKLLNLTEKAVKLIVK